MTPVGLRTIVDLVFAAGAVVAALALAGAALRRIRPTLLVAVTSMEASAAVAAWVAFALRHGRPLAVSAAGLTGCALAATGALLLRHAFTRLDAHEAQLAEARSELLALIEKETADRAVEVERTLARARADSTSLLEEQERQVAEERRKIFTEREREASASFTAKLLETQSQIEQRLAGWTQDLERAAEATRARIAEVGQRQEKLLTDTEARMSADADRLATESEQQRAALVRLRTDLDRELEEVLAVATAELETHATERRRALHELENRMQRRERELLETIQREEAEAVARIKVGFEDVQRRQVEQMGRVIERSVGSFSEDATQQFAGLVKSAKEDAAKRLARELERSASVFAREAEGVLAERLAHVGDAGAQRVERRLSEITTELERARDDWMTGLGQRMSDLESEIRRRLEELSADAEAERGILEARLRELVRRFDAGGALHES